jgi:tRNA-2-methylthio-N6-dimethylallyladenosine synthase
MTYYFETYGCQMNIAESAATERLFVSRGWTKAEDPQVADAIIVNTCSIRATAESRIHGRLGWLTGLKALRNCEPEAKSRSLEIAAEYVKDGAKPLSIIFMGCMAERLLKTIQKDYPAIDYVVGTYAKHHFGEIIEEIENHRSPSPVDDFPQYQFAPVSLEPGAFTSMIPIMHGCNNFCTYCIVPYVRGREVSRPVSEIMSEIDVLSKYGVKEITLLGQTVNSYHFKDGDTDVDFATLLSMIAKHIRETSSSIGWVRFMSSHPIYLNDELIDVISKEEVLCHHIHIAVQHGSSRILKAMNRRHTVEFYIDWVNKIRSKIPNVSLTTDIMIGFPGETDEDFEDVIKLMKEVRFENAFMYYYNPREGTKAATMEDQIPLDVKKERLQKVIDLQLQITRQEMEKRVGLTTKVLVEFVSRDNEGELLGKTEQDERVVFKADKSLIGKFAEVRIDELSGNTFRGTLV